MALEIKEQQEHEDYESSMELDPFSLFINAIRADGNIKHARILFLFYYNTKHKYRRKMQDLCKELP